VKLLITREKVGRGGEVEDGPVGPGGASTMGAAGGRANWPRQGRAETGGDLVY
jgi:hypothetical protein